MRFTRIEIEGQPGRFATIARKTGDDSIAVTVLTPETPEGHDYHVAADDREEAWAMAKVLQRELDGYRGTGQDRRTYFDIFERFMD